MNICCLGFDSSCAIIKLICRCIWLFRTPELFLVRAYDPRHEDDTLRIGLSHWFIVVSSRHVLPRSGPPPSKWYIYTQFRNQTSTESTDTMFCSAIFRLKRAWSVQIVSGTSIELMLHTLQKLHRDQSLPPNNLSIQIWCGVAGTGLTASPMLELGKTFMEFYCGYQWLSFSAVSLSTGIYLAGLALLDSHYPNLISIYRSLGVPRAPTICLSSRNSRLLAVRTVRTFHMCIMALAVGRWQMSNVIIVKLRTSMQDR